MDNKESQQETSLQILTKISMKTLRMIQHMAKIRACIKTTLHLTSSIINNTSSKTKSLCKTANTDKNMIKLTTQMISTQWLWWVEKMDQLVRVQVECIVGSIWQILPKETTNTLTISIIKTSKTSYNHWLVLQINQVINWISLMMLEIVPLVVIRLQPKQWLD